MKIITYGIHEFNMDAIRWHYGKADYFDASAEYRDILALPADIVIINLDRAKSDIVKIIKEYENETKQASATKYEYINETHLDTWMKEYFEELDNAMTELSNALTEEEFEALYLFRVQKILGGIIYKAYEKENAVTCYEFFRDYANERELLIVSLGYDLIASNKFKEYMLMYDDISVAWYNDSETKKMILRELYEHRCDVKEVPFILRNIKIKLDERTKKCRYAAFGE